MPHGRESGRCRIPSHRDVCEHPIVLRRSSTDRVLTGVAGGLGERLAVDPVVVRLAFVALAFAGGVGVLAYVALALVCPTAEGTDTGGAAPRTSAAQAVAVGLVVVGALLLMRGAGLWFGDRVVWPAVLAVAGSGVIWARGDDVDRRRVGGLAQWLPLEVRERLVGRAGGIRAAAGGVLVAAAVVLFVGAYRPLAPPANAPFAVAAAVLGLLVLAGPWVMRLVRSVGEERRERIRQQERAEMAAHLHDSVLQTLALIQRAGDPSQMATLARVQERELRLWLYGRGRGKHLRGMLSTALDDVVDEVERAHRVRVETVLVGDCRLDDGVRALVDALREAVVNAAKHSSATAVSVYVEVEPDVVAAFVRDEGVGFERTGVPLDRRGIAESIEGRMTRNGGIALVESLPGRGTEVRLRMPRNRG
jgi:signal transduction histidine kinase/phage shock protein PspC (stress-responsive transcriptional regulator)